MADKIIVILGPTASGKSDLAVKIAQKFSGEVVSADSRQVYKDMNIGTGKISEEEMKGIPHHLLGIASPKRKFTVVQYRKLALKAINKIFKKGKTPILCGGTGFYIQAVVDGIVIPEVPPDWTLRKKLERKTPEELFRKLKQIDPKRAKTIERENKRRLIRAIEIVVKTKRPVPLFKKSPLPYPVLMIGVKKEKKELSSLIRRRLLKRLKKGMVDEVKKLRKSGISWKRLEEFGLEYRWIARYLKSDFQNIDFGKSDFFNRLQKETERYAKRQMTWFTRQNFAEQNLGGFKRDKRIHWIKKQPEAEKLVKKFLEKK